MTSRFARHIATAHAGNKDLRWYSDDLDLRNRDEATCKNNSNDWIVNHFDQMLARSDLNLPAKFGRCHRSWLSRRDRKRRVRQIQLSAFAEDTVPGRRLQPRPLEAIVHGPYRDPQPYVFSHQVDPPYSTDSSYPSTPPFSSFRDTHTYSDSSACTAAASPASTPPEHTPMPKYDFSPQPVFGQSTRCYPASPIPTVPEMTHGTSHSSNTSSGLSEAFEMPSSWPHIELEDLFWSTEDDLLNFGQDIEGFFFDNPELS